MSVVADISKTEIVMRSQPGDVAAAIQSIEVTQVTQGVPGPTAITVSATPPVNPFLNQLWFDTSI